MEKRKILIIDDEASNLKILSLILGEEYTVFTAKSGRVSLDIAKQNHPDLILLDIIMPDMDGTEVLAQLKALDETKNIPVIITTGLDEADEKATALRAQTAACIQKPFSSEVVKEKVGEQIKIIESR